MPFIRHGDARDGRLHVVPQNDLREHVVDPVRVCWCDPTEHDDDVIVHNSMDRRELYERGELKPH